MPHRVEYSGDGTSARIIVDLDGASLDSDALPIGSQWQTLKNVLTHIPGVLPKRGAIVDAGANSDNINDASGALAFYDGRAWSGNTNRPYCGVCVDGSSVETYLQSEASSRLAPVYKSINELPLPVSKCPTVANRLVIAGRDASHATYPNRAATVTIAGGCTRDALYDTGSATFTVGSATVTGSGTTWTSAMEGSLIRNDVDSPAYGHFKYQVKKVVSATSIILDRAYAGDSAGAGKTYCIASRNKMTFGDAVFGASGDAVRAKIAASAWRRLVLASTRENAASGGSMGDSAPEFPNRLRWSGVIDSSEGPNTAACGMFGFSATGYVDLDQKYGEILAVAPSRDFVSVFQESGLTILRGAPVYDGSGSLDASEVYPGVALGGGFAFESTPEGVFFFDKNVGPCVYNGSRVERLGDARVTRTMLPYGITAVGYYDGKVVFSGTTTAGLFVFDTRTAQWSFHEPPAVISCLIAGRVENNEDLVGLGAGTQVVNVANIFDNPGVAATDWDGTAIIADIKTGKLGSTLDHLRPERLWITYRLTDLTTTNPYLVTTTTTGLPDTSDSQHTYSNGTTDLVETSDVETKKVELNLAADPMAQIRVLQTNGCGKLEIYSVIVDCAVEGEGASS